jgi:hypothetical protein
MAEQGRSSERDDLSLQVRSLLLLAKEALELGGEHQRCVALLVNDCITLLEPDTDDFETHIIELEDSLSRTHTH